MKRGKKYKKAAQKLEKKHDSYELGKAVEIAKSVAYTSFPSSITAHINIKLPKDKDAKSVKGAISLPNPVKQKEQVIYVFTSEENAEKALKAGATKAGLDDLVKEVKKGEINFDIAIATTDVMPKIAVLGRELGPKGLMPSPKNGTVISPEEIEESVKEYNAGKMTFASDETGVIHMLVGTVEMEDEKIVENVKASTKKIIETVGITKVGTVKGVHLSPTMGVGVKVDVSSLE